MKGIKSSTLSNVFYNTHFAFAKGEIFRQTFGTSIKFWGSPAGHSHKARLK